MEARTHLCCMHAWVCMFCLCAACVPTSMCTCGCCAGGWAWVILRVCGSQHYETIHKLMPCVLPYRITCSHIHSYEHIQYLNLSLNKCICYIVSYSIFLINMCRCHEISICSRTFWCWAMFTSWNFFEWPKICSYYYRSYWPWFVFNLALPFLSFLFVWKFI